MTGLDAFSAVPLVAGARPPQRREADVHDARSPARCTNAVASLRELAGVQMPTIDELYALLELRIAGAASPHAAVETAPPATTPTAR